MKKHGFAEGGWRVDRWDTAAGAVTETQGVSVGENGVLRIAVGPVEGDIALRLRLEEKAGSK